MERWHGNRTRKTKYYTVVNDLLTLLTVNTPFIASSKVSYVLNDDGNFNFERHVELNIPSVLVVDTSILNVDGNKRDPVQKIINVSNTSGETSFRYLSRYSLMTRLSSSPLTWIRNALISFSDDKSPELINNGSNKSGFAASIWSKFKISNPFRIWSSEAWKQQIEIQRCAFVTQRYLLYFFNLGTLWPLIVLPHAAN